MEFIELGSENSYNYKEGLEVTINFIRYYSNIQLYNEGDIIEAGWINKENTKA